MHLNNGFGLLSLSLRNWPCNLFTVYFDRIVIGSHSTHSRVDRYLVVDGLLGLRVHLDHAFVRQGKWERKRTMPTRTMRNEAEEEKGSSRHLKLRMRPKRMKRKGSFSKCNSVEAGWSKLEKWRMEAFVSWGWRGSLLWPLGKKRETPENLFQVDRRILFWLCLICLRRAANNWSLSRGFVIKWHWVVVLTHSESLENGESFKQDLHVHRFSLGKFSAPPSQVSHYINQGWLEICPPNKEGNITWARTLPQHEKYWPNLLVLISELLGETLGSVHRHWHRELLPPLPKSISGLWIFPCVCK